MIKAFNVSMSAALLVLGVSSAAVAEDGVTMTSAARSVVCAQTLGFATGDAADRLVVVPRGSGSARLERVTSPAGARSYAVGAYDLATCQAVQTDVWVQEDTGAQHVKGNGPVVNFTQAGVTQGYYEIRANRSIDRDLGFALRHSSGR